MKIHNYKNFILEYKNRNRASSDIEDFADLYIDKVAKKLNTSIVKKLGMGNFGIAYLTRNNKVLKVTTDSNEAKNALSLKGEDLEHFLNYYDIFSLSLDGKSFKTVHPMDIAGSYDYPKVEIYFILMEYVKPLKGWKSIMWERLHFEYFNDSYSNDYLIEYVHNEIRHADDFEVSEEYYEKEIIPYFEDVILNQRQSFFREASELGVNFSDAHDENLGERKDGTLVYFDIGYGENLDMAGSEPIKKVDFENDFKKIKKMIISKYEPGKPIPVKEVISDISKLLNINKVKAYKYLRDEVWAYRRVARQAFDNDDKEVFIDKDGIFKYPLSFTYKGKDEKWSDVKSSRKSLHIDPSWKKGWKKGNTEVFLIWEEIYKSLEI